MGFSQKSVYALRAIYELAKRHGQGATSIPLIAEAQNIPPRFLENILLQLKQASIVDSLRGREGGYALARAPEQVTVGDVLRAIEGAMFPVSCLGDKTQENCPMRQDCVFIPMWREAQDAMLAVYDGTSFEDLLARGRANEAESAPMYSI